MKWHLNSFEDKECIKCTLEHKQKRILDRNNKTWSKFKKDFDAELVYNYKYLENKIKSCQNVIKTNFHDNALALKNIDAGLILINQLIN